MSTIQNTKRKLKRKAKKFKLKAVMKNCSKREPYHLSKRTAVKAYAGYADGAKAWKDTEKVVYNGYQVYLGLRHAF